MEGCHESRGTGQGDPASTEIGVECHRGRARERRVPNSELCRDRRRNPCGLHIYRHSVFRGERKSYRHRRQSGERHSSLCAVINRRICRCLYHRFSCRHVRRTKKPRQRDRKSTRLNSSHVAISYAVFCLKKKKKKKKKKIKKKKKKKKKKIQKKKKKKENSKKRKKDNTDLTLCLLLY